MPKLHPKQEKILEVLKENKHNNLSIKDLSRFSEIDSPGILYHHLGQLEKKGYIKRNPDNPKDYFVMDSPEKHLINLNKYGLVKCGPEGFFLDGNVIDQIPIATSLLRFPAAEAFLVEASGDSMEPKIKNGDIIIARKTSIAEHGELIVCVHNSKAMLKVFSKNEQVVSLKSLNFLKYDPIPVTLEDEFQVVGTVKNIISYQKGPVI